ncbi:MAG: hypothetical protein ACRYGR_05480 [Janthinobacterium lividum]
MIISSIFSTFASTTNHYHLDEWCVPLPHNGLTGSVSQNTVSVFYPSQKTCMQDMASRPYLYPCEPKKNTVRQRNISPISNTLKRVRTDNLSELSTESKKRKMSPVAQIMTVNPAAVTLEGNFPVIKQLNKNLKKIIDQMFFSYKLNNSDPIEFLKSMNGLYKINEKQNYENDSIIFQEDTNTSFSKEHSASCSIDLQSPSQANSLDVFDQIPDHIVHEKESSNSIGYDDNQDFLYFLTNDNFSVFEQNQENNNPFYYPRDTLNIFDQKVISPSQNQVSSQSVQPVKEKFWTLNQSKKPCREKS